MKKVTSITETSLDFVKFVAVCHKRQMRLDPINSMARLMAVEIEYIAKNYGARVEIGKASLTEFSKFVLEKFGYLAVEEIRKAYQMWASEEIKVEGGEIYGGSFNVRQIGKVLAAYNEVRKKVLGNYLRLTQDEIEQREQEAKATAMKEKFEAEFPSIVLKAKEKISDWREVPEYFYEAIKKRWGIPFENGEAKVIFEDAKELAIIEIKLDESESFTGGLKARFEAKEREKNFDEIAKVIARKLTVFRKVIKNPNFQIAA